MRNRFTGWLRKAAMRWSGIGGQSGTSAGAMRRTPLLQWFLPGSRQDWKTKAGDLWKNSIVGICLNWWTLSFPEAKFCVKRLKADGTDEIIVGHPLTALIDNPNEYDEARDLWFGTLISLLCDGNAYWYKIRNRFAVGELWYVPHYEMEPRWPEDGSEFISHYERWIDGKWNPVDKKEIVHFRFGKDPDNPRKGLALLKAQLRQVFSDNEISTYYASILENFGVCSIVISSDDDADYEGLDSDEAEKIKKTIAARTSGDERGKPMIFPTKIKVDKLAFSPEEMLIEGTAQAQISRICAALFTDPMIHGLPSEGNTHYDNREQAERGAWNNGILPVMAIIAGRIRKSLGDDFGLQPGEVCDFDTRAVKALQENWGELVKIVVAAAGGPVLTPDEGRAKLDYPALNTEESKTLRQNAVVASPDETGDGGSSPKKPKPGKKDGEVD